jgi:hypothetical protein
VHDLGDGGIAQRRVERRQVAGNRRGRRADVAVAEREVRRREIAHRDHHRDQPGALGPLGGELDGERHPAGRPRRRGELGDRIGPYDDPGIRRLGDAGDLVDLGRGHADDIVGRRHLDLDLVDQDLELELGEQLEQDRQVPLADDEVLERHRQRHVAAQLDQLARDLDPLELLGIAERLLDRDPRHHRVLRDQVLERAVLLEQIGGGLVTDPADPRDVVAGVTDQREEVGDLLGRHAHLLDDLLARVRLLVERVDHRTWSPTICRCPVGAEDTTSQSRSRASRPVSRSRHRFRPRHDGASPSPPADRREELHPYLQLFGRRLRVGPRACTSPRETSSRRSCHAND